MSVLEAVAQQVAELTIQQQMEVLGFVRCPKERRMRGEPLENPRGLWADLGIDISAEDIDEARKEMWGNFPREDIA